MCSGIVLGLFKVMCLRHHLVDLDDDCAKSMIPFPKALARFVDRDLHVRMSFRPHPLLYKNILR